MSEGRKITDPAVIEACRFINGYYEELGQMAPDKFSSQAQHAITVLAAYIRSKDAPHPDRLPITMVKVVDMDKAG